MTPSKLTPEFLAKRSKLERWALELAAAGLTDGEVAAEIQKIPRSIRRAAYFDWKSRGRPQQQIPAGEFSTWVALPGRGWGKTDTGAHAVRTWDESGVAGRIALIGATAADVRDVMVNGDSGILAAYPKRSRPWWRPTLRCVDFHKTGGGKAFAYSSEEPKRLRGPQHHKGWGDELVAWARPQETLDQVRFGLRLGAEPQLLLTTTPQAVEVVQALVKASLDPSERVAITRGSTFDNAFNLPDQFLADMVRAYGGTRLGRQELEGELLEPVDGLFRSEWIHYNPKPPEGGRVVVGLDPAITTRNDETGIVVVKRVGDLAFVLEDASGIYSPAEWADKAVELAGKWGATAIVAEVNRGGDLVREVLGSTGRKWRGPVREVRARTGKDLRAEPIAALYEQGRVFHREQFRKLESQMLAFDPTSQQANRDAGRATSPDRLDALVWAIADLGFHLVALTFNGIRQPKRRT